MHWDKFLHWEKMLNCPMSHTDFVSVQTYSFFTFLHTVVENILSLDNIQREKSNVLKYCLEQMPVNKELHDKWNELLTSGTVAIISVVVLQKVVTFFL